MNTNSILRWGIIAGLLLTLFIPLYVENSLYFPFITGKAFAFRIIVEIVFALWLILALRDPSVRPRKSLLVSLVGAFLLSLLVSVFLSANPDKSFWSNFERMEGWIGIAHVAAYFLVLFSVYTAEKYWKWLWNTTIGVSVIEGVYGIFQLLGWAQIHQGGVRLDGTFGNATYLAIYMVLSFYMTLLACVWWGRRKDGSIVGNFWAWGYGVALALQLVMVFYTATRGAILGLVCGLFIAGIVFLFSADESKNLRRWGIGALAALVVLGGIFFAIEQTPFVQNNEVLSRLATIDTPQKLLAQGGTRFAIWGMAWQGFLERPVFGWGQESFNYVFNKFYQPSLYSQEMWFDRAHNEFLDWLVAGGAVGFLLYVSLFGAALWYLFRRNAFTAAERGLFVGLLAAYTINNLFVFDNLMSYVLFFTVLAFVASRAAAGRAEPASWRSAQISAEAINIATPIIVVVLCATVYFVNVPGIMAARDIIQGLSSQPAGLQSNFDYFKQAVDASANGGLGSQEVHEQLMQFAGQVKILSAGNQQFQSDVQSYTTAEMQKLTAAMPNDARIRLFFGTFLLQNGDLADARTELTAAHELSPGKQQILFELGALEASAGNYPTALAWLKEAYDSAPGYDTARTMYAAAAIEAGDSALASSLLLPRYGTVTPDDTTILQAYMASKNYPDALTILAAREAANPNDAQTHLSLAQVYLGEGNKTAAISEIQKIVALDPSFAQQGQYYIQQIQAGK